MDRWRRIVLWIAAGIVIYATSYYLRRVAVESAGIPIDARAQHVLLLVSLGPVAVMYVCVLLLPKAQGSPAVPAATFSRS